MMKLVLVESRKSVSEVVVTTLLIFLAIVAVSLIWYYTRDIIKGAPFENSCIDASNSFSLKKACYLNQDEIKITIERGFDNFEVSNLILYFSNSVWEIKNKRCTDIRLDFKNYNSLCIVSETGSLSSYILNFSGLEKENSVGLSVKIKDIECSINRINVEEEC